MSEAVPATGRIVHYRLSAQEAAVINKRRSDGERWRQNHGIEPNGRVLHIGNTCREGDTVPLLIVRVWPGGSVNGQAFLDGNDTLWVTSASEGREEEPRTWSWPPRV